MSLIGYAFRVAKKYYEPKTYDHALRVAGYVAENSMIHDDIMDNCIALAIMHDLIEDTKWCINIGLGEHFEKCLNLLTKPKGEDYVEYIKKIKQCSDSNPEAYWVKIADIKDHLTQKESLTEELRDKYLDALPYLL